MPSNRNLIKHLLDNNINWISSVNFPFESSIGNIAGKENSVADSLSRIEQINLPIIVTTEELVKYQKEDKES